MTAPLSRRRALSGAATLGVGVPLLAACGDDGGTTADDPATPTSSAPTSSAPASTEASASDTAASSGGLVATSEVPVGGGVVVQDAEIVVTQPSAGEFKAFTAICTHQGCLVSSVADGKILCACHGSSFEIADGAVSAGPASAPLAEVAVAVEGDQVVRS